MTALDQAFIRAYTETEACTDTKAYADTDDGPFRPMLQVDRFTWPSVSRRLDRVVGGELDRLADALAELAAEGQKVLAIAGCRRGEGATTMLLCAGKRLADRQLNVVLLDADPANPQLARRLGIQPEYGWEDVLAGRMPPAEVVVESVADRMAVLPACDDRVADDRSQVDKTRMAENIDVLAGHYDLVLVDVGPLDNHTQDGKAPWQQIADRLDAVVLVRDVRTTTRDRLAETLHDISAAGLSQAGVVQNFARAA